MKVYTKVVLSIETGELIDCDWFEYCGPVALCKDGGGDTSINSYDPTYNAGLLLLQEAEGERSEELFNQFMYGVTYNPEETVQGRWIDGQWVNKADLSPDQYSGDQGEWIENPRFAEGRWVNKKGEPIDPNTLTQLELQGDSPSALGYVWQEPQGDAYILNPDYQGLETTTLGELYGYDPDAVTSEMEYLQNTVEASQSLLGLETNLAQTQLESETRLTGERAATESAQLSDIQRGIAERAPVRTEFYNQALNGIDIKERMNQSQADVEHAFGNTKEAFETSLQSSGYKPGEGIYTDALNKRLLDKTKGIAGARTQAKTLAENEIFNRLQSAVGLTQ